MIDPVGVSLLLGVLFALIFMGLHIAYALGLAAVVTALYLGIPLQLIVQNIVSQLGTFALMAVPFFILAGEIMGVGGISDRLIKLSDSLVGWMRGGLAQVNIVASMFFGGISGSATADTASLGSILIPMMRKAGYDDEFSTTVTMTSSIQGILIPPSHNMVIFAIAAGGVSVGRLFLGGFGPGLLLGVALMIYCFFVSIKKGYPKGSRFELWNIVKSFREAILGLGTVLIVVVGVVGGVFTATESAAIAAIYAFVVTYFVYREAPLSSIWRVLGNTIRLLSVVLLLTSSATAFSWFIGYLRIPESLAAMLIGFSTNKFLLLLIINIMLLLLGMVMNMVSIIMIVTPILMPVIKSIGMDPVQFGTMVILNLGIGLITPPVGQVLFVGSSVSGVSIERLTKALLPFLAVMIVVLMFVSYVPAITLTIPNLIMPTK